MEKSEGSVLPFGVKETNEGVNFSLAVKNKVQQVSLLLYKKEAKDPVHKLPMFNPIGNMWTLMLKHVEDREYEYNYLIDTEVCLDPYVEEVTGREKFGEKVSEEDCRLRGKVFSKPYDWEGDVPLNLPYHSVIAYSLHLRGFTKHSSSGVKRKGTYLGLVEKIPYLTELGINQIHCMPLYDFVENQSYQNYWGYGEGNFFAPKPTFAAHKEGKTELKDMIKACHKAGIEVILEMPFTNQTSYQLMIDCLRYYVMEYHVDGFIINPEILSRESLLSDGVISSVKIMYHDLSYQTVMRRFLKGDEGMVQDAMYQSRRFSGAEGTYNYITNQNGFTLLDLVSYDGKHNEGNGEGNSDGPVFNYSWNCGAEGPSRKKAVRELRQRQIRNAFFLLLTSQGVPLILAGDEFGNSQKGNNNVYCQDNPIGWVDWSVFEKNKETYQFVKELIAFRKSHPILHSSQALIGQDQISCGVPDVSYHGESAWIVPKDIASRHFGVFYCGKLEEDNDIYIAYNMHWLSHKFAIPAGEKAKEWYLAASTKDGVLEKPLLLKNQRMIELEERTIWILVEK
ncbi:isoamylase [Aequitasia blattaphilus]|uniref:Alpha-amylase family glycosyl hydrolase n=1 Tax=Aequitasia blattaphilus TaxID=2949332 RepID=A0ABT1E9G3_9FIRM|nr:alpha-amylase family glycosyl hydrolase [Aequitasia blattaphilus]MCP1101511.1 alpha-amylase family glycosyl hydrolase [Aequitasia blattaphilus]MCR8614151.1 alpha-amylase family glycosyl hydrolase [Aequitasia blattaphilus]